MKFLYNLVIVASTTFLFLFRTLSPQLLFSMGQRTVHLQSLRFHALAHGMIGGESTSL